MHSLKPITLDLKPAVDRLFEIENSRSADFCFGNVYMWDKRFKQSVTLCGDRLVTLLHRRGELFPSAAEISVRALNLCRAYAAGTRSPCASAAFARNTFLS